MISGAIFGAQGVPLATFRTPVSVRMGTLGGGAFPAGSVLERSGAPFGSQNVSGIDFPAFGIDFPVFGMDVQAFLTVLLRISNSISCFFVTCLVFVGSVLVSVFLTTWTRASDLERAQIPLVPLLPRTISFFIASSFFLPTFVRLCLSFLPFVACPCE